MPNAAAQAASQEAPTEIQARIEQRAKAREVTVYDVTRFFGAGDKPLPKIGIRTPTKYEQDCAIGEAHKYVEKLGLPSSEAKTDRDILQDLKSACIVWQACREVKPESDAPDAKWVPTGRPAFPTPEWVARNIEVERIGVLLNLVNAHRRFTGPAPIVVDDEQLEAMLTACSASAGTDRPYEILAGQDREWLVHAIVQASLKLELARGLLRDATEQQPAAEPQAT